MGPSFVSPTGSCVAPRRRRVAQSRATRSRRRTRAYPRSGRVFAIAAIGKSRGRLRRAAAAAPRRRSARPGRAGCSGRGWGTPARPSCAGPGSIAPLVRSACRGAHKQSRAGDARLPRIPRLWASAPRCPWRHGSGSGAARLDHGVPRSARYGKRKPAVLDRERVVPVACRSDRLRAADASWSKGAHVGIELLEASGERFDVGVGERAGEVLLDPVVVLAAGACHRLAALVGLDHED
jgi:hypothetical protein